MRIWNRPTTYNGDGKKVVVEIAAFADDDVEYQTVRNAILSTVADLLDQMQE